MPEIVDPYKHYLMKTYESASRPPTVVQISKPPVYTKIPAGQRWFYIKIASNTIDADPTIVELH